MKYDQMPTADLIHAVRSGNLSSSLLAELCYRTEKLRDANIEMAHQLSIRGRLTPTKDTHPDQAHETALLIHMTDGEYTTQSSLGNLR